uniref:Ribosomal protein L33 n=1 Tax=Romanomermis culicivorax TaxID=13658 RepID=A0A915L349_ROMCU
MQSTERNQKEKLSFRSIQLVVTVGGFPQNCICPFRPKMNSQAERFKVLTIRSVPSQGATFYKKKTGNNYAYRLKK